MSGFACFKLIRSIPLSCSFRLCSMKWNRTEFLYHPQLLQVQIITQRNWRQTLKKKSQATTLKTHRRNKKKEKDHFKVFFLFFEEKKEKKTARSNQILKRPKTTSAQSKHRREAIQRPSIYTEKSRTDLKPEVCAYSTALTKHTSQRCS